MLQLNQRVKIIMNYFEVRTKVKTHIEILEQFRAERSSLYASEHILVGYRKVKS